jgi:hypothetical protein
MKIMNGNLGKPWQLIHFVSSRPDHFFHSELLFGLHEFPVDADGHIGIDAAKENLRGVDRVVPVKFENNLEFRLRWSIIEGRQEGSSLLFVVRNNVLVHDRHSGMIKQPRRPRRDRDPNGAVGAAYPTPRRGAVTNGPVQIYHLGIWFNTPEDATAAGCKGVVPTNFTSNHRAGPQILNTGTFPNDAGPLLQLQ